MAIHQSKEDYLERILMLQNQKGYAKSIDIANELHFSRPSVSIAMKSLKNDGYISIDEKGRIFLLDKGRKVAQSVLERHEVLKKYLINIGVSPITAEEDACKIEHCISEETFNAILSKYKNEYK